MLPLPLGNEEAQRSLSGLINEDGIASEMRSMPESDDQDPCDTGRYPRHSSGAYRQKSSSSSSESAENPAMRRRISRRSLLEASVWKGSEKRFSTGALVEQYASGW